MGSWQAALFWFLSFTAGRWVGPCLSMGYSATGSNVWRGFDVKQTKAYKYQHSWTDHFHVAHFQESFAGFMKRFSSPDWRDVVQIAIHWFIEANGNSGALEGSIVMIQTGLEMLGSEVLVEQEKWLGAKTFRDMPAADKIRLLLKWAGIPSELPKGSPILSSGQGSIQANADGPTAITMIRNAIIHHDSKNRKKFGNWSDEAKFQAREIGLWYLELLILRLFDYMGTYSNRLKAGFRGQVEKGPWDSKE